MIAKVGSPIFAAVVVLIAVIATWDFYVPDRVSSLTAGGALSLVIAGAIGYFVLSSAFDDN